MRASRSLIRPFGVDTIAMHGTDTAAAINLTAGQRVPVVLEYYENLGNAVVRLNWQTPGATSFVAIPRSRLYAQ